MTSYRIPERSMGVVNENFEGESCTDIKVNHFGYEVLPEGKTKPPVDSALPSFRLHFIYRGMVELSFGKKKVTLEKNSVFCLIPKTNISYRVVGTQSKTQLFWVSFDGTAAKKTLRSVGITEETPYAELPNEEAVAYFCASFSKKSLNALSLEYFMLGNFHGIFSLLAQNHATTFTPKSGDKQSLIQNAVSYIANHLSDPKLCIADVANHVHVHPNYLSRVFKAELQTSFVKYLNGKRVFYAIHLIKSGFTSVEEIAQLAGFSDSFYFSRVYKKYNGIAPSKDIAKVKLEKNL